MGKDCAHHRECQRVSCLACSARSLFGSRFGNECRRGFAIVMPLSCWLEPNRWPPMLVLRLLTYLVCSVPDVQSADNPVVSAAQFFCFAIFTNLLVTIRCALGMLCYLRPNLHMTAHAPVQLHLAWQ